jgi:predicted alpha/beta hydrolase
MSMKSNSRYSMNMDAHCDGSTLLCRWFGSSGNYGVFAWLLWLVAIALVWWLLWNLWKWFCGCMGGDAKSYKKNDVYTAHKNQKMNMSTPSVANVKMGTKKESTPIAAVAKKKDDLKIVEGIGPKVEKLLHNAGVMTFADLAKMTPASIKKILTPHGSP